MKSHPVPLRPARRAGVTLVQLLVLLGLAAFTAPLAQASDPTGVFAVIDKVTFEPAEGLPERILIHGTFSLADARPGGAYHAPEHGYLYYQLPKEKAGVARIEWKDLQSIAGKGEVIGFGSRRSGGTYTDNGKVRKPDAQPANPDVYRTGFGLVRMGSRPSDYAPIRDTLELHKNRKKAK